MRDLSKFKVLGITLLVTMSSCVAGAMDFDAESLKSYCFEFDISANDKIQAYQKTKKASLNNSHKFLFTSIVKSARCTFIAKGLTLEPSSVVQRLSSIHFNIPLINKIVVGYYAIQKSSYSGVCISYRAGPLSHSL